MDEIKVGDQVKNRLLGPPVTGTVYSRIVALDYVESQKGYGCYSFPSWDENYQGWRDDDVVFVELDRPSVQAREDERFPDSPPLTEFPLRTCLAFPARDLEVLE